MMTSTKTNDDVRYCTCGTKRSRQDGYTRLNDMNDWGCGRCRKPTLLFLQNVILPREQAEMNEVNVNE